MIQVLLLTLLLPTAIAAAFLLLIGRWLGVLAAVGLGHAGHLTGGAIRMALSLDAPAEWSLAVVSAWMLAGIVAVWLAGMLVAKAVARLRRA
jgi:hypothetical protein